MEKYQEGVLEAIPKQLDGIAGICRATFLLFALIAFLSDNKGATQFAGLPLTPAGTFTLLYWVFLATLCVSIVKLSIIKEYLGILNNENHSKGILLLFHHPWIANPFSYQGDQTRTAIFLKTQGSALFSAFFLICHSMVFIQNMKAGLSWTGGLGLGIIYPVLFFTFYQLQEIRREILDRNMEFKDHFKPLEKITWWVLGSLILNSSIAIAALSN